MKTAFWTNTVWYVALAVISAAMIAISLVKAPLRKKTLAFFFAVLGMTYFFEAFLLIVTDAYAYYPQIASDSFHESLIGNFFSQYSVSASAVLIATLGLRLGWRIGFSIVYFLIDILFIHLCIYSQSWYRSWYTLIGFFIYSWGVKKWHEKMFTAPPNLSILQRFFLAFSPSAGTLSIRR